MKKEINPAVTIGMIVVLLVGIAVYFWQANESRTLPSIRRGSVRQPGGGATQDTPKPGAAGN